MSKKIFIRKPPSKPATIIRGFSPKSNIKVLPNGGIKYRIFKRRAYKPELKSRSIYGSVFNIFDNGDSLTFVYDRYVVQDKKAIFSYEHNHRFVLSFKNGKFNCYKMSGARTKNCVNFSNKFFKQDRIFDMDLKKTSLNRISKILSAFAARHGFKQKIERGKISSNIFKMCYPALGDFGLDYQYPLSKWVSRYFKQDSIKYGIKKCFGVGSNTITKTVTDRLTSDKNFDILYIGTLLKKVLPIDDVYFIINNKHGLNKICNLFIDHGFNLIKFKKLLTKYSRHKIKQLLKDSNTNYYTLKDTVRFWDENNESLPESPRSFTEIHDFVTRNSKIEKSKIKNSKLVLEIDNASVNDRLTIVVPKCTSDLAEWSNKMNNCVRNYGGLVRGTSYFVLGVLKDGVLTYNISIKNKQIEQFFASCNRPADEQDKKAVEDFLIARDLLELSAIDDILLENNFQQPVEINREMVAVADDIPF